MSTSTAPSLPRPETAPDRPDVAAADPAGAAPVSPVAGDAQVNANAARESRSSDNGSPSQSSQSSQSSQPSQSSQSSSDDDPATNLGADFVTRLDRVFAAQQAARPRLAASDASARRAKLKRLLRWVEGHQKEIRQAAWDDFRKPATEVDLTEIYPVVGEARFAIRHLARWMRPQKVRPTLAMASTRSRLIYEPRGVALVISPWNYPFNLTLVPLISAIAAGNAVILKPSEMTPHMSALLAGLVEELFDESEVALFEGEAEVARALLARPFDHVFFTGSPRVGKLVMKAAAEHLSTVTLELGGKSPVIIDRSAHLGDAAEKVAWGKFVNQGQTCIAPDYVLVDRRVHDAFVARLGKQIEKFYGSTPEARRSSRDLARIVDDRHFARLGELLDESVAQGARVAFGGGRDVAERFLEPTLLVDVPDASPAMQEEIFGPVLPIVAYDDLDQALATIRAREKPLALYMFGHDQKRIDRVLEQTSAGGTCINEVALHFLHLRLPFGGVNHSGHGSSHGVYGFRAFSHERPVLRHHRWSALKLMSPPYSRFVRLLTKLTVKFL